MKKQGFSLKKRLYSIKPALNGLKILFKEEHNARLHAVAACSAIIAGFYCSISANEWIAVLFSIALVISMEAINSSIEGLADFCSPEKHEKIKAIKDLAAAAVLISALTALLIGFIVFLPKFMAVFCEQLTS